VNENIPLLIGPSQEGCACIPVEKKKPSGRYVGSARVISGARFFWISRSENE
jgi:hypothetical protein